MQEAGTVPGDLIQQRRFYAEEVQAVCGLRTAALVEALAAVPREAFLPPGPWLVRGEGDMAGPPRATPDADPRRVYHNVSIAIDGSRHLYNGAPGVVAQHIDALDLSPGKRVLHVGCGYGYYSAVMAACVGPGGHVDAIEVDAELAAEARVRLAPWSAVRVYCGDGARLEGRQYDAVLVSAGVTHPQDAWLDALAPGGRLVVPLTFTVEGTGPIGKGVVALIVNDGTGRRLTARCIGMIAIYSALHLRDASLNDRLREAFVRGSWPTFRHLRRDGHDRSPSCWLHGDTFCLTSD